MVSSTAPHGTPALPKRYFQALRQTFGADCEVLTVAEFSASDLAAIAEARMPDILAPLDDELKDWTP